MDLTQLLITALAVLGIVVMGLLAVVPTVLEFTDGPRRPTEPSAVPVSGRPARDDHELAA